MRAEASGESRGGAPRGERVPRRTRAAATGGQAATPVTLTRPMVGCAFWRSASLHFGGRIWEGLSYSGVAKLGREGASREGERVTSPLPARGERELCAARRRNVAMSKSEEKLSPQEFQARHDAA